MSKTRILRSTVLVIFVAAAMLAFVAHGFGSRNVSVYVTFYGYDDNDDGNIAHRGTAAISNPIIHSKAQEDLGTFDRPGTLAADIHFLSPGTRVYVPALHRYYIMEDTCRECTQDWEDGKLRIDLYVDGRGKALAECEDRLTMEHAQIIVDPPRGLPVMRGKLCMPELSEQNRSE
jgi:hypothetical protein